jgi:hypothetical protein
MHGVCGLCTYSSFYYRWRMHECPIFFRISTRNVLQAISSLDLLTDHCSDWQKTNQCFWLVSMSTKCPIICLWNEPLDLFLVVRETFKNLQAISRKPKVLQSSTACTRCKIHCTVWDGPGKKFYVQHSIQLFSLSHHTAILWRLHHWELRLRLDSS